MKYLPSVSSVGSLFSSAVLVRTARYLSITLLSLILCLFTTISAQAAETAEKTQQQTQTVNINQASAEEIAAVLIGVGEAKALAIVAYREANGAFKSIEQLLEVKGIGAATLAKNKERLSL